MSKIHRPAAGDSIELEIVADPPPVVMLDRRLVEDRDLSWIALGLGVALRGGARSVTSNTLDGIAAELCEGRGEGIDEVKDALCELHWAGHIIVPEGCDRHGWVA